MARRAGIALANGIECDHEGRTNVPGVVAVGDCASWHDLRRGRAHRVEHWTGALERPLAAVTSLLGGSAIDGAASKANNVPYFWSDQYDVRIQFAGHAADADSVTSRRVRSRAATSSRSTGAATSRSPCSE